MEFLKEMPLSIEIIAPIGFFLCLCIALPVVITVPQVAKMRRGMHLTRVQEEVVGHAYDRLRAEADWALGKGFDRFEGMYVFTAAASASDLEKARSSLPLTRR